MRSRGAAGLLFGARRRALLDFCVVSPYVFYFIREDAMRLNRSLLEFARFARFFALPFVAAGALMAAGRFALLAHSRSAARVALDLGLLAWALLLGALALCAAMAALVAPEDDPPTVAPSDPRSSAGANWRKNQKNNFRRFF